MQQVASRWKWGFLAVALAMFALAFSLFAATPAQAADDLAAGDVSAQADKDAKDPGYFDVYVKIGDNKEKLAKSYTEEEFNKLASTTKAQSYVFWGKGKLQVVTTTQYATLTDVLEDAGIAKYWVDDATLSVYSSDDSGPKDNARTKKDIDAGQFYPATTTVSYDDSDAVAVPAVFAASEVDGIVADDEKAGDVAKANESAKASTDKAPRLLFGYSAEQYKAENIPGNQNWNGVAKVVINISQEAADQADADAVWPFKVYVKQGDKDPVLVKEYTKDEFTKLAVTDGDPISGLYFKGDVWNVSTALTYVPLTDLLADAGVVWGKGATIGYGGDPSQGKSSNSFTYEDLQKTYFYPNTTAGKADTSDAVQTPFVFGLKTSNGGVKIGDDKTAADVQKAAAEDNTTLCAPYAIVGSLEDEYTAGEGTTVAGKRLWRNVDAITITYAAEAQVMYRLYNPNSGEHHYTADADEKDSLVAAGWTYEDEAWTAPTFSQTPVYRLYNPYEPLGDHHYTTSEQEYKDTVAAGWIGEGIGWYSDDEKGVGMYRVYNPNAYAMGMSGAHHYTADKAEADGLVAIGWTLEKDGATDGAWYGVKAEA